MLKQPWDSSLFNILITQDESLCLHLCAAVGACLYPCWSFSLAYLQWCTHHYCVSLHADTPVPTFGSRVSDYCCALFFSCRLMWSETASLLPYFGTLVRVCSPLLTLTMMYCITPALDRYIMLLDRTPHTQTMTSLNICGISFYNHWHSHTGKTGQFPTLEYSWEIR